jgi:hypothetical protein
MREGAMRDIRSDLQERANLIEEEISETVVHFEKTVERLQGERDVRVAQLKAELAVLGVLIEAEHQRMPNDPRPIEPEHSPMSYGPLPGRMLNGPRPVESEHQRMPNGLRPMESERQHTMRPMALPRQSLADFLARKLAEIGPRSKDDLSSFAVQEGYFPDTERASPGVHATLMDLLRGDRIRQLPNGTLTATPLSQMIRLRQTV